MLTPMSFAARSFAFTLLAALSFAAGQASAQGSKYPTKPIRLLVPFAPGGGTDIVARVIAQKMTETLGQSVIVDNRPGAGGTVGTETAVRANPDGYTLIMVSGSYATNAAIYKLAYDPVNDIQPIVVIGESAFVLALHPAVPAKTVAELIGLAKAKPGALNYGSSGPGGLAHLATELFELLAGTRMTHVPYRGSGPALPALLGNQIQVMFGVLPATIPHVKANRLRGLGVTGEKRTSALPELPTIGETVKGYLVVIWWGVLGPKGLPKDLVNLWHKGVAQILQSRELQDRLSGEGIDPVGGSPEAFSHAIQRDVGQWKKVVKEAKLTVEP